MRKFKKETCDTKLMKSMGQYVLGIKKHGTLKIQDIYSIRGLEHMDRDIAQYLIQGRRMTIKGVLQEQARQNEIDVRDVVKIATISNKYSRFSVDWRQRIVAI